jgi:hypothetical protein
MTASRIKARQFDIIDWNAVGERIGELRGFHMTQLDFARSIEVGQKDLSNWGTRSSGSRCLHPSQDKPTVREVNRMVANGGK